MKPSQNYCNFFNLLALFTILLDAIDISSAQCPGRTMISSGVSEYEKQIILDTHNKLRQSVALGQIGGQPPAANMMELKWDNELANRAQMWASSSCVTSKHDKARHLARFPVGQNMAATWTTKTPTEYYEFESDFATIINKWFNEYKTFRYGPVRHGPFNHYTQMIWAETNLVGCGYAFYYDARRGYTKNYVCNYGPSGNVVGKMPYKKGYSTCNDFSMGQSHKYSGLCDKSDYYFAYSNYLG